MGHSTHNGLNIDNDIWVMAHTHNLFNIDTDVMSFHDPTQLRVPYATQLRRF